MKKAVLFIILLQSLTALGSENTFCPSCRTLVFKENKNQWHADVRFQAEMRNGNVYLENQGFTYLIYDTLSMKRMADWHHGRLPGMKPEEMIFRAHALKVHFENANAVKPAGEDKLSEYFNYFLGNDHSKWASHVNAFGEIRYANIYSNIDLRAYSHSGNFKYDFIVKRGGDALQVAMRYDGASKIKIKNGALQLATSVGDVVEMKPYAYQFVDGNRQEVKCEFRVEENTVHFIFPQGYDREHEIVIDPTLIFSTYSGSFADNFGYSATYDSRGNAYAAGSVFHQFAFPTTPGALQTSFAGGIGYQIPGFYSGTGTDMGITKYDSAGTQRLYSTYFGGRYDDLPHSMIVNSNDELLLFGTTGSDNFPVTASAYDTSFNGGPDAGLFNGIAVRYLHGSDIVVARFSIDGTVLIGSTYVGGSGNDGLNYPENQNLNYNYADEVRGEIEIDNNNNIIIATCTNSPNFPVTTQTYQSTFGGGQVDGCVFKLNTTLTQLVWSTYLGGSLDDAAYSVAFDKNKDLYVCGGTRSPNFPVTPGTLHQTLGGGRADGFISHLSKDGKQLLHSTYYGSPAYDQVYFVECSKQNQVYVLGQTEVHDSTFIKNSLYNRLNSGQFISKLSPGLDSVEFSNVFGTGRGLPDISPTAFLVDLCNKIYVSGWGSNLGIPGSAILTTGGLDVTANAFQPTTDSNDFYVMVMEDDASLLNYATYFGSSVSEEHVDGGTSRFDRKGVIYQSVCAGCGGNSAFPTAPANVVSHTNNSPNCNNAIFKFDFNLPGIVADFDAPPSGCAPVNAQFLNKSKTFTGTTFQWFFGDGGTSTAVNPSHIYNTPGLFTITLVVFDAASCNLRDTLEKQILILKSSKDTLPSIAICSKVPVQLGFPPLNDTSIHYQWTPSTYLSDVDISNPISTPDSSITYFLYASNGICIDTFYQSITVVNAGFRLIKDTAICPGDTIHVQVVDGQNLSGITYTYTLQPYIISGNGTAQVALLPPNDTTLTVTVTSLQGCIFNYNIGLRVFIGQEVVAAFTLPPTGCAPVTGTLQNNTVGAGPATTYFWRFGDGGTSTLFNPAHTWAAAGNFNVTLIVKDSTKFCQPLDSATQQFLVVQNNQVTVVPQDTICTGLSQQLGLNTNADTTATLTWTPNLHLSNPNIKNPIVSPDTSTTYTLTVSKNGCTFKYVERVIVIFDSLYNDSDTNDCPNDTLRLNIQNLVPSIRYTYLWSPHNLIVSGDSTGKPLVTVSTDTTFTVIATNNFGCSYTLHIRVHAATEKILSASFNAPSSGCLPFTASFTNTSHVLPTTNYYWTFGDGFTSSIASPAHAYARSGAYYVRLVLTDPNSCNKSDTAIKPILILDRHSDSLPDKVICKAQSVTIGINGVTDTSLHFRWTPAATLSDSTISNPVATPAIGTTYTLFVNNGICTDTFTQRVRLFNEIFSLLQDTVPCPADTFHIRAVAANTFGVGFAWQPAALILHIYNGSTATVRTSRDTFIFVTITSPLGCVFTDSLRAQVLDELSVRADFNAPLLGCAPFTTNFTNTSHVLNHPAYLWTFGDGATSTQTNPSHVYNATGAYVVTLLASDTSAFCTKIDSIKRTITVAQNFQTFILPNDSVCFGSSVKIGPNAGIDTTSLFLWNPDYHLSSTTVVNPQAAPVVDTNYHLTVNQSNCTFNYVQKVVVLKDSLWITGTDPSCAKTIITLTAHHTDSTTVSGPYTWSPSAYIRNGQGFDQVEVSPPSNTIFSVQVTDAAGCTLKDSIAVNIFSPLTGNIDAFAIPDTIHFGDTTQLQATSNITANIIWQKDSTLSDNSIANPKAFPLSTHRYFVEFTDDHFCKKEDTVIVYVQRTPCSNSLFVPNAFSPNGDGKNDVFRVRGNDLENVHLMVFDRWGQLVFETRNLNDGWDGVYKGARLDPAVFGWIAEGICATDKKFLLKGNVTLLR